MDQTGHSLTTTPLPTMQYREVEVTVLSAQDLKNVNFLGGAMNPYAEVWIYSSKKEQTGVCSGGGRNPSWDCALKLACEDRLFTSGGEISVAVYSRGSFSSNTLVGTVTVPLSDLIALLDAADESQSSTSTAMSCQIWTKGGKAQGVLNLAVKVGAMVKQEHSYRTPSGENDTAPVVGYPAAGPYPRRLPVLAVLDRKEDQYIPPEYHPRYGQPAALYQQAPSLKLPWATAEGSNRRGGAVGGGGCGGGGCGGGCGGCGG